MILKTTAPILLAVLIAGPGNAEAGQKMLIHGNYCGPGNNAPLATIDALDAACARHDACTPDNDLPSKSCNLGLQMDAERVANDGRQPEDLRMLAGIVASGAAMMPSKPSGSYAYAAPPSTMPAAHRSDALRRPYPNATEIDGR